MPQIPSREKQRADRFGEPLSKSDPDQPTTFQTRVSGRSGNIWNPTGEPKIADLFKGLSEDELNELFKTMQPAEVERLKRDWDLWARPNQKLPPDPWRMWWIMAGRGFGKTRTGAECVKRWHKEGYMRFHLVAPTAADARDVMVEGESGLLAVYDPRDPDFPNYEPSKRRLTWPNGAVATLFSDETPDRLRGPQCEKAWADEPASWTNLRETFDNLQMGLRLGDNPQLICTTTPKPKAVLKSLLSEPGVVITRGSTYDNAPNLAGTFLEHVLRRYEGTRTGLQELHAVLLEEAEGALWTRDLIENNRVRYINAPVNRIVVAMDPADGKEEGDEQAIAVCAQDVTGEFYVVHSEGVRMSPLMWAKRAISLFLHYRADRLVYEANRGGEWVAEVLRTASREMDVAVGHLAVTATKNKRTRAEPISALYEQGRVHHLRRFEELEDQMCNFTGLPGEPSPDRLDALVWAMTFLAENAMIGFDPDSHVNKLGETVMDDVLEAGF